MVLVVPLSTDGSTSTPGPDTYIGAIIGGVFGGIVFIIVLVVVTIVVIIAYKCGNGAFAVSLSRYVHHEAEISE